MHNYSLPLIFCASSTVNINKKRSLMSVLYNIIQRGEPGIEGGGTKKFYASAVINETIGIEDLTYEIEKLSTVNGADVRAVLYGIVQVVPELLAKGNSIQLGDLGFFRVGISSEGADSSEEIGPSKIRKSRVLFRTGRKLYKMLNNLTFKKHD